MCWRYKSDVSFTKVTLDVVSLTELILGFDEFSGIIMYL